VEIQLGRALKSLRDPLAAYSRRLAINQDCSGKPDRHAKHGGSAQNINIQFVLFVSFVVNILAPHLQATANLLAYCTVKSNGKR
jgi:hypothetical protein